MLGGVERGDDGGLDGGGAEGVGGGEDVEGDVAAGADADEFGVMGDGGPGVVGALVSVVVPDLRKCSMRTSWTSAPELVKPQAMLALRPTMTKGTPGRVKPSTSRAARGRRRGGRLRTRCRGR